MATHGSTELTCRALLEHPRRVRHSHIAVVFDAVLKGTALSNGSLLFCSFRYVKKKADESTDAGVYDVTVRVARYEAAMHEPSPTRVAQDFTLMGDITALYPVPLPVTHASHMADTPIHVSASGRVDEVDGDTHTFAMTISQPLNGVIDAQLQVKEAVLRVAIERISFLPPPRSVETSLPHLRRRGMYAS